MDDVPVGGAKAGAPGGTATRSVPDAVSSQAPDRSLPLDPEATVIAAGPLRPDSAPAASPQAPGLDPEATFSGALPRTSHDAPTVAWSDATVTPRTSAPRSPSPEGATGFGTNVILGQIGTVLGGRYEILELLGEGGMGAVYKASDREVDRIVALKVIRPEMASNPEILARFKQELLLSSKVTHRNVIRIYDLGEAQGLKFITMEYLEGQNLFEILKQQKNWMLAKLSTSWNRWSAGLLPLTGKESSTAI